MSLWSQRPLSMLAAKVPARRVAPAAPHNPIGHSPLAESSIDIATIRQVLAPEERLLAVLRGVDARGAVVWVVTPRRFIVVPGSDPLNGIVQLPLSAITCVDLRTDPVGSQLRVRATGRHFCMHSTDTAEAMECGALLRERAGLGVAHGNGNGSAHSSSHARPLPRLAESRVNGTGTARLRQLR